METEIKIDTPLLIELRRIGDLIRQQQILLDGLQLKLSKTVEDALRIDLAIEEWELDLDNGYIRQQG